MLSSCCLSVRLVLVAALLVAGPVLMPGVATDYLSHTLLDDAIPWLLSWVLLSWTMLSAGSDVWAMKSRGEQRRAESRGENIVSPVHVYARMQGKRKAAYQEAAACVRCGKG